MIYVCFHLLIHLPHLNVSKWILCVSENVIHFWSLFFFSHIFNIFGIHHILGNEILLADVIVVLRLNKSTLTPFSISYIEMLVDLIRFYQVHYLWAKILHLQRANIHLCASLDPITNVECDL